jgi:hypothetical protein
MGEMKLDMTKYTHRASFYGIPCYFGEDPTDPEGCELAGVNWLCDALLPVASFIHNHFIAPFFPHVGFPLTVKGEIEK